VSLCVAGTKTQSWRKSREYRQWKVTVIRLGKVCRCCGSRKDRHAHHIKKAQNYPDLRFAVENGIVLCKICHSYLHNRIARGYRYRCGREHLDILLELRHIRTAERHMREEAKLRLT